MTMLHTGLWVEYDGVAMIIDDGLPGQSSKVYSYIKNDLHYIRCIDRRNLTKNFEKVRKNVWLPQDSRWSAPVGNHNLNLLCFMICISTMPSDAR